jgi:hypothetical protein
VQKLCLIALRSEGRKKYRLVARQEQDDSSSRSKGAGGEMDGAISVNAGSPGRDAQIGGGRCLYETHLSRPAALAVRTLGTIIPFVSQVPHTTAQLTWVEVLWLSINGLGIWVSLNQLSKFFPAQF